MNTKLAIVINSCYKYHERTLQRLSNVSGDIFCVVGESPEDSDQGNFIFRRWANVDNNGLIWVVQDDAKERLRNYEWIFYMHDTCMEMDTDSIRTTFEQFVYGKNVDAAKLYEPFSMSMGYYRLSTLWSHRLTSFLNTGVNYDTSRETVLRIKKSVEDSVFRQIEKLYVLPNEYKVIDRDVKAYGSTVPRIVEEWTYPSFKKYKANYCGDYEMSLEL